MKIWTFYPGAQSNTVCVEMLSSMDFMVATSYVQ